MSELFSIWHRLLKISSEKNMILYQHQDFKAILWKGNLDNTTEWKVEGF